MKTQQLFNQSVSRVIAQGKPSIEHSYCKYKSEEGLCCAVGHLISDEFYSLSLENKILKHDSNVVIDAVSKSVGSKLTLRQLGMLEALQLAHDNYCFDDVDEWLSNFKEEAAKVAKKYNLSEEVIK